MDTNKNPKKAFLQEELEQMQYHIGRMMKREIEIFTKKARGK